MLRLLGILVTVVLAVAIAVVTWPSFFRVERTFPIAQIVSFRSLLIGAFLVLIVLVLLLAIARPLRGFAFSLALVLAIAIAANTVIVVSRGVGTDTLPARTDTSIRVMTWNTAGKATPATEIAQIAVAMDADIVTLPETTIETGEQVALDMRDLGHPMWAFSDETAPNGLDYLSTTVLITPQLGEYTVKSATVSTDDDSTQPSTVAMPVSGEGPIVVAAHAVAPRVDDMGHWVEDLRWLADQCSTENVIIAGDFNATVDHLRAFGVDGADLGRCSDAAVATGNGSVGTWSTTYPSLLGSPIDHVMVSNYWHPTGSLVLRTAQTSASDHRPLIVQLEPTIP